MIKIALLISALLLPLTANAFNKTIQEIAESLDALAHRVSYLADVQSNYQCQIKLGSTSMFLEVSRDCLYDQDISCALEGTNPSLKQLQQANENGCDRQVAIQMSINELQLIIKALNDIIAT